MFLYVNEATFGLYLRMGAGCQEDKTSVTRCLEPSTHLAPQSGLKNHRRPMINCASAVKPPQKPKAGSVEAGAGEHMGRCGGSIPSSTHLVLSVSSIALLPSYTCETL